MPKLSMAAAGIILLAIAIPTTPQPGTSPKDALNPRTYRALKGIPESASHDELLDRLEVMDRRQMELVAQQSAIQDQLRTMLTLQSTVAANTQQVLGIDRRVGNLEDRMRRAEDTQAPDGVEIKVLQVKIEGLVRVATWLLAGIGSLVLGGIGFMAKQVAEKAIHRRSRHRGE